MWKKRAAALLAAVLLCGLLAGCVGKAEKDAEYSGSAELVLTDWMRYISAAEAMYADLDWALSYASAFGSEQDWDALLRARAAVELAAKRIELRVQPAWDAPAEAYDYFTEREADVSFVPVELENFESNRQMLLNSCNTLRQHLMSDVFFRDGLSRTADAAEAEAKINQATLEYLAYSTEYLLMELDDAEWTEKVHESMKDACPRIAAVPADGMTTSEEVQEAALTSLDAISEGTTALSAVAGRSQAELDLMREAFDQRDFDTVMGMFSAIDGLPVQLPDPGWALTEASYYWKEADGSHRFLTEKEDIADPPEGGILRFADTTEDEVAEYLSLLHDRLGLDGERSDGEGGYYDVFFQAGDSVLSVSWTDEGAKIYMMENPVCLAPDWFILANAN